MSHLVGVLALALVWPEHCNPVWPFRVRLLLGVSGFTTVAVTIQCSGDPKLLKKVGGALLPRLVLSGVLSPLAPTPVPSLVPQNGWFGLKRPLVLLQLCVLVTDVSSAFKSDTGGPSNAHSSVLARSNSMVP